VYAVTVKVLSSNPEYIGDYSFRIRAVPGDDRFELALGATVSNGVPGVGAGNIEQPGGHDVYRFTASAGALAFFERLSVAAAFEGWLQWELRSPTGQVIFRSYFGSGHDGRKVLPETGEYTLRVADGTTSTTHVGEYSFRIRAIPPDQSFPIEPGQMVSNGVPGPGAGNIEVAGAWDYYTFGGVAGQTLFFEDVAAQPSLGGWLIWEAKAPSGQTLFRHYFGGGGAGRKTLPETGTYTIRCAVDSHDPGLIGTYAFLIQKVDDGEFALSIGDVVTNGVPALGAGMIETPGGEDVYTFNGTADQEVVFGGLAADAAFGGWLRWEAKTPSGLTWFSSYFGLGAERRTLPETGEYRVRVFVGATSPAYVGGYSFRIYSEVFAWPDRFALSPGGTLAIPKEKLLCNDTCGLADTLGVELPEPTSVQGGTLVAGENEIVYVAPSTFAGVDTFVYRIRGRFGGVDTSRVTVEVRPGAEHAATVVSLVRLGPTQAQVCLLGLPGQVYRVEHSTDLLEWEVVGELRADTMGGMVFTYPASTGARRFYRFPKP
jgi:hypothetical protein